MSPTPSTPPLIPTPVAPASPSAGGPLNATSSNSKAAVPLAPGLQHINTTHRGSKRKRDRSCSPAVNSDVASPPSSPRILRTHIAHLRLGSAPIPPLDFSIPSSPLIGGSPRGIKPTGGPTGSISPLPSPKRTRRASISSAVSNASDDESDDEQQLQNTRMSFPVPAHLRNIGPSPLQNSFSAMFTLASSPPKTRSVTKAATLSTSLQPSLMANLESPTLGSHPAQGQTPAPSPNATANSNTGALNPVAVPLSAAPAADEKAVLKVRARLLNVDQAREKEGTEVEKLHVLGYGRALRGQANGRKSSGLSKQRDEVPQESLVGAAEKMLKAKSKMQIDE